MTTPQFIDTHIHLDFEEYDPDRPEVIDKAYSLGVTKIITIGSSKGFDSAERAKELSEKYGNLWFTAGIHPHAAETEFIPEQLLKYCSHPKHVAVGEAGLDFFRDWSPKELQYKWFKVQVELALQVKKPLIIHSREAGEECLQILKEFHAERVGGVFHCFSEDVAFAKKLLDINFLVSFPGSLTFKKNTRAREIINTIPLEQIMLETDGPYMAPEPFRGKRSDSSHVIEVAKVIAEVKSLPLNEVARITTMNAQRLFKI
jgi:TatD DNase family protein